MGGFIIVVLALLINVALHEFGHMIVAKKMGVEVPEYAIGMGPTVWSKEYKGTTYYIKALPIGGYCSIPELDSTDPDTKYKCKHLCIILAGVVMNFIIGFCAFWCSFEIERSSYADISAPKIISVTEQAKSLGFKEGDYIVSVNDTPYSKENIIEVIRNNNQLSVVLSANPDLTNTREITIDKTKLKEPDSVGITVGASYYYAITHAEIPSSFSMTCQYIKKVFCAIPTLLDSITESTAKTLDFDKEFDASSSVTIVGASAYLVEDLETNTDPWITDFLNLLGCLGINLFICNLIPIPCVDGGRFILMLLDIVSGNRLHGEVVNKIIASSFILLFGYLILMMGVEGLRLLF